MTSVVPESREAARLQAQVSRADELERLGRFDEARALLRGLVDEMPDHGGRRTLLARLLLRRGERDASIVQHRAALALDPGNPRIALSALDLAPSAAAVSVQERALGVILRTGAFGDAAALWPLWRRAAPLSSRLADAILRRAVAQSVSDGAPAGDGAVAASADGLATAFDRMCVLADPADASPLDRLARRLIDAGRPAEALALGLRAARLPGVAAETLLLMERLAHASSRADLSRRLVELAAVLDPSLADPQGRRANALLGRGRLGEALDAARQAALLDPGSALLGRTLRQIEVLIGAKSGRSGPGRRRRPSNLPGAPAVVTGRVLASVTLPSLRPDMLAHALLTLQAGFDGLDYEVLVVSRRPTRGRGVRWIEEAEPRGSPNAAAVGFAAARGDVMMNFTDDLLAAPGALRNVVEFVMERERAGVFPFQAGMRWLVRGSFDQVGIFHGFYFAYHMAMTRRSVERAGGWFDGEFRSGFADVDLSLRVWHRGGRVEQCRGALIYSNPLDVLATVAPLKTRQNQIADYARFRRRWQPVLPGGWGPSGNAYSYDLMNGFLVDDTAFPDQAGRDFDAYRRPAPPA